MKHRQTIAIVGASSAIAKHCARVWASKNIVAEFILIGRSAENIKRVACDLRVRYPDLRIQEIVMDFLSPHTIQSEVANICKGTEINRVLIAHGMLPDQRQCQEDLSKCYEALAVNAISPVLYAEAFAKHMKRGVICLIGSIAGDRGRKGIYTYGSAKSLVEHYANGLQHRFANGSIKIVLIKPGPTDTPMTAHLKTNSYYKLSSVETVASQIVSAIEQGKAVAYVPRKWQFIMWIIRNTPRFIFNKISI